MYKQVTNLWITLPPFRLPEYFPHLFNGEELLDPTSPRGNCQVQHLLFTGDLILPVTLLTGTLDIEGYSIICSDSNYFMQNLHLQ